MSAIVLAAGSSSRMRGAHKLLVEIDGVPMLRRTTLEVLGSRASRVVVVVGHRRDEVVSALAGLRVTFVVNARYASGLSESVKAGLSALTASADGALICLGDMPLVRASDLDALIGAFESSGGEDVIVPTHGGRRGNPVLWPHALFDALSSLEGDSGARRLIGEYAERVRPIVVGSRGVLIDIDTPEDMTKLSRLRPS